MSAWRWVGFVLTLLVLFSVLATVSGIAVEASRAADLDTVCMEIAELSPQEATTAARVALAYAPGLSVIALLSEAIYGYGYTLPVDTVYVQVQDDWHSAYPEFGAEACGWIWSLWDGQEWTDCCSTDSLKTWMTVRGWTDADGVYREGGMAEPAEVR